VWAEIILTRDDLARLLARALPLTIALGAPDSEHSLTLSDLGDVTLVADSGVRLVCRARVRWPLLGLDVPVESSALTVVLIPTVQEGTLAEPGDRLVFRASIEHAELGVLPAILADRVTAAINVRLAAKEAELSWNFSRELTSLIPLPEMLEPLESLAVRPAWGKIRITSDAVVYAASFHTTLVRRGDGPPPEIALPAAIASVTRERTLAPRPRRAVPVLSKRAVAASGYALAAGVAYFALRYLLQPRS